MDSRKLVFKETAIVAIGQVVCIGVMFGVLALLSKFDSSVLLGTMIYNELLNHCTECWVSTTSAFRPL